MPKFRHHVNWSLVVVKELLDNALDACEEADIAPVVEVKVDDQGLSVADNGPGLPEKTIEGVLDYPVRISSREAYVAPDRGVQGNALKTLVAMPFVLDGPNDLFLRFSRQPRNLEFASQFKQARPVNRRQDSPTLCH